MGRPDGLNIQPAVLPRDPQIRRRRRNRPRERHAADHDRAHWRQHYGQTHVRRRRARVARRSALHTPVYVLTHERRGTVGAPRRDHVYFVNDGPEHALALARESAGGPRRSHCRWRRCDPAVSKSRRRRRPRNRACTCPLRCGPPALRELARTAAEFPRRPGPRKPRCNPHTLRPRVTACAGDVPGSPHYRDTQLLVAQGWQACFAAAGVPLP